MVEERRESRRIPLQSSYFWAIDPGPPVIDQRRRWRAIRRGRIHDRYTTRGHASSRTVNTTFQRHTTSNSSPCPLSLSLYPQRSQRIDASTTVLQNQPSRMTLSSPALSLAILTHRLRVSFPAAATTPAVDSGAPAWYTCRRSAPLGERGAEERATVM